MNLIRNIRRMRQNARTPWQKRGVAALEFALTLPIWITFLLGMSDGTFYMLVNEKTDRIAYSITDIVAQYKYITKTNLNDIVKAAAELMSPFTFGADGVVVITSVFKPIGQVPKICWQYKGGGTLTGTSSKIGAANRVTSCSSGSNALLPAGLTLNDNENIIISEVYYNFTPLFLSSGLFPKKQIYRYAIYKPRLSPLVTPPV